MVAEEYSLCCLVTRRIEESTTGEKNNSFLQTYCKIGVSEIAKNLQKYTCVGASFHNICQALLLNIKRETLAQVFFCRDFTRIKI